MSELNLLFVCGRNRRRSPTGAAIYNNDPRLTARSAGVSKASEHQISRNDLHWADLVLVMESRYRSRILREFRDLPDLPKIVSLDIPDDFEFMDDELVELLRSGTEHYVTEFCKE